MLDNLDEKARIVIVVLGAIFGYLFGGFDALLGAFMMILIIDTCTGMLKAWLKGEYSSKKFREGFVKKIGYMIAIILAVQIDKLIGNAGTSRTALLFAFSANESASIIENLGLMGVPIPDFLSESIACLKKKK